MGPAPLAVFRILPMDDNALGLSVLGAGDKLSERPAVLAAGMRDMVTKPFAIADLVAVVILHARTGHSPLPQPPVGSTPET